MDKRRVYRNIREELSTMKLNLKNITIRRNIITAEIDSSSLYVSRFSKFEDDKTYTASISEQKKKRSINQNNLLWALISKITKAIAGERATAEDEEEIYAQLLEKYGISVPAFILPEDLNKYVRLNRVVKTYGETDGLLRIRAFPGSSRYTSKEMNMLIEGALDELADLGIWDADIVQMSQDYQELMKQDAKQ